MTSITQLKEGYRAFYQQYFSSGDGLYRNLATGQAPKTLIIACSDSRVDPGIITQAKPGDIFVIRNVANLVPPYETGESGLHGVSAALEFAVRMLQVEHVVVLGHSHCAGIKSLLEPDLARETDFIGKWVEMAAPAKDATLDHCANHPHDPAQHVCEKQAILLSLNNLLSFPWIKSRSMDRTLTLHGWYFSVQDGSLQEYDPENEVFTALT